MFRCLICVLQQLMKKHPTLPQLNKDVIPSSKQRQRLRQQHVKASRSNNHSGLQSFKMIERKVTIHDEQIIKNEKIILTLTQQFRVLKDQLLFEQECNQQNKKMIGKLQESNKKNIKQLKQYRILLQQKDKEVQNYKRKISLYETQRSVQQFKQDIQKLTAKNQEFMKQISNLNVNIRTFESKHKQLENLLFGQRQQNAKMVKFTNQYYQNLYNSEQKNKQFQQKIQEYQKQMAKQKPYLTQLVIQLQSKNQQNSQIDSQLQKINTQYFRLKDQNSQLLAQCQNIRKQIFKCNQTIFSQQNLLNKFRESQKKDEKQENLTGQKIKHLEVQLVEYKNKFQKSGKIHQLLQKQISQAQKNIHKSNRRISQLQSINASNLTTKQKLNQTLEQVKGSISCEYCQKIAKNCVTIIPCGHSYCQQCKKGYDSQCKKCKHRKQAVYRNQLMDQIIAAYRLFQNIKL